MPGFSVGVEAGRNLQYSKTTGFLYSDTVGDVLDPTDSYKFGLFTYLHTHEVSGQQFDVVNYWVEPLN